jgi:hypothetical protein
MYVLRIIKYSVPYIMVHYVSILYVDKEVINIDTEMIHRSTPVDTEVINCSSTINVCYFTIQIKILFSFVL